MRADEIRDILFKPLTKERKDKAIGLCRRASVSVDELIATFTPEQKAQWEAV